MSRIIVYDLANRPVGEFNAVCNRGYMVYGTSSTAGGGSTTITVNADVMRKGWLQPGRMVLVLDKILPPWAGVVDTPMDLKSPAQITLYNAPYILTYRTADRLPVTLYGNINQMTDSTVRYVNRESSDELYVRVGNAGGTSYLGQVTVNSTNLWEQLVKWVNQSGSELTIRPEHSANDGRLYIYLDLWKRAGVDTGYLLREGPDGNFKITSAKLDRRIINYATGFSDASSETERIYSTPVRNEKSIAAFRMRSQITQFKTSIASNLQLMTQNYVDTNCNPIIKLDGLIMDVKDTFKFMQPGNGVLVHAPNIILPDGREGWRGAARIMTMAFNEQARTLGVSLEATYEF